MITSLSRTRNPLEDLSIGPNHLYAVQRKDSEARSRYPYSYRDPNNPAVDFDKFFDGDSLDQEDIVM